MTLELTSVQYRAAYGLGFVIVMASVALGRYELPLMTAGAAISLYSISQW